MCLSMLCPEFTVIPAAVQSWRQLTCKTYLWFESKHYWLLVAIHRSQQTMCADGSAECHWLLSGTKLQYSIALQYLQTHVACCNYNINITLAWELFWPAWQLLCYKKLTLEQQCFAKPRAAKEVEETCSAENLKLFNGVQLVYQGNNYTHWIPGSEMNPDHSWDRNDWNIDTTSILTLWYRQIPT